MFKPPYFFSIGTEGRTLNAQQIPEGVSRYRRSGYLSNRCATELKASGIKEMAQVSLDCGASQRTATEAGAFPRAQSKET